MCIASGGVFWRDRVRQSASLHCVCLSPSLFNPSNFLVKNLRKPLLSSSLCRRPKCNHKIVKHGRESRQRETGKKSKGLLRRVRDRKERKKKEKKNGAGNFRTWVYRDIFSRFDGFFRGITSQPASPLLFRVLFRSSFYFVFFFSCVEGLLFLLLATYRHAAVCIFICLLVCMLCYHCSVCLLLFLLLLALTWFVFCFGSTERRDESTRPHVQTRERPSRQADLAAEASLHTYIWNTVFIIYNMGT